MSKIPTLELTPGQDAPAPEAPKDDNIVIDSTGRVLKLAELDVLAESRLIRLVGAEAAINQAYMQLYVMPAMAVVEIDAEPMPLPQTQREIDAAISRLGHHGINAVIKHWAKQREDKADQADKEAAEKAALKN
ncbi:hypothetical protein RN01_22575 [Cupriavidus sp. SHE]|jgi:hypothetical protein|uniref:Uncharacterized protein n=1 Tax=Cupriavidus metallidurans TaxID=119219 RepID=A0A482IP15_9BURK|nr:MULTISPECIES: hypothetical protein [Cupriavidus]KWR79032.1 hypothetical protein RN01_22575 [Cupriavidus sp. SHE]QBP09377.1 hypothetical protein DDF84_006205 [Cupriavidus metallidurans]